MWARFGELLGNGGRAALSVAPAMVRGVGRTEIVRDSRPWGVGK
jgi:hypothetical protein